MVSKAALPSRAGARQRVRFVFTMGSQTRKKPVWHIRPVFSYVELQNDQETIERSGIKWRLAGRAGFEALVNPHVTFGEQAHVFFDGLVDPGGIL